MNLQRCKKTICILYAALFLCSSLSAKPKELSCAAEFEPAPGGYQFIDRGKSQSEVPEGATIGKVHYTRLQIFDESNPLEDKRIYRWANRFHVSTRQNVIENQLLIASGDRYEARLNEESARILRTQKYLYDATVRPVNLCDGSVDIEVITREVWSFTPEVSFKRAGGDNTYRFSIRDTNVFGTGTELGIAAKKGLDRDSNEFKYKNNNIMGSRIAGRALFSDNNDGSEQFVTLHLPFYSLDSQRSWGIRFKKFVRNDPQFFRGEEVTEVAHDSKDYMLNFGFSNGLDNGVARRWSVGYRYQEDSFTPGKELPPPAEFPIDKKRSYPFIGYASVVDDFATASNFDQILRTEDVHLGHTLFARLGYAASAFGSDQDRIVVDGAFDDTIFFNNDTWWRHKVEWAGLWNLETDKSEDVMVDYTMRYFRNQTKHRSFFASFNAVYTKNLNSNQQVFFGGDTGARAFDNRFQVGDRRVVLTLEERLYSDIHILNLVRLGWALFVDVGKAWKPGFDSGFEDDYLANVGFGLRLASTKADAGRIVHIDFSIPLTNKDNQNVNSSEISISIKDKL